MANFSPEIKSEIPGNCLLEQLFFGNFAGFSQKLSNFGQNWPKFLLFQLLMRLISAGNFLLPYGKCATLFTLYKALIVDWKVGRKFFGKQKTKVCKSAFFLPLSLMQNKSQSLSLIKQCSRKKKLFSLLLLLTNYFLI